MRPALGALGVLGLIAGLVVPLTLVQAQEGGGVLYRFGVTQEVRHRSNPGLARPANDPETLARTRLSFDVVSETDVQRLSLSASGALELGDDADNGLATPSLRLAYRRDGAAAAFDASVFLNEVEVDTLEFDLTRDAAGNPLVSTATGTGRQRRSGVNLALELGRDAPFGGTLSFGRVDTRYIDTNDPNLIDSQRDTLRLALRFDLSEVTKLTATATGTRLREDNRDPSDTSSLSLRLSNDRPDGVFDITANATRTEAGERAGLSIGRRLDLPRGSLAARLGIGQSISGRSEVTGSLDWIHDLPRGRLTVGLDQRVTENDSDDEIRLTSLSVGLAQEFTPRLTGQFDMGLRNTRDTGTDVETRTATLSATLRYELAQDWNLGLSATHRHRDQNTTGEAASNEFSLSLSRNFSVRR